MKTLLLLTFVATAMAKCPNGCSGNGVCGEWDMCKCYTNWVGADCSQRQCLSGVAWVTTARGDINYDGDKLDATAHHPDHRFTSTSVEYLVDQHNPKGTWESWPSTFAKNSITDETDVNFRLDEGHFYMECSNRGICDRKTGQCECFPGYTGENCRRTTCPDDCSGHGRCQTVGQQAGSFTYNLWDKDMSRSCVCDPGFVGPACADRACPKGDDPLTTDKSSNEVQWVDVYTEDDPAKGTDGPFSGTIKFKYTDYYGQEWVTGDVAVVPADGVASTYTTMATAAEKALEALPNNVLRDVQVTAGMCAAVVPGQKTLGDAAVDGLTANMFINIPTHTTKNVLQVNAGADGFTIANSLSTYTAYPGTPAPVAYDGGDFGPGTVYKNLNANCVRFQIYFVSTPGDLNQLVVDTSGVTVVNQDTGEDENTNQGATSVGHRSTDTRSLGGVSSTFITDGRVLECSGADADNECTTDGSNEITIGAGVKHWVHTYDRIQIECGSKMFGTYTVSDTTVPTATVITTLEAIPSCAGTATSKLKISVMTNTIWVNGDLTAMGLVNGYVKIGIWTIGPVSAVYWQPGVSELSRNVADDADIGPYPGRILISGGLPHQPGGTTPYSSYTGDTSIKQVGTGQSEMSECSDRGVCEPDTGVCKCFGGYTGNACEKQNALSA